MNTFQKNKRQFTEVELQNIRSLIEKLKIMLSNPNISEDGFKELLNVESEIKVLVSTYYWRLLNLSKQKENLLT